jgi:hypothetical protein
MSSLVLKIVIRNCRHDMNTNKLFIFCSLAFVEDLKDSSFLFDKINVIKSSLCFRCCLLFCCKLKRTNKRNKMTLLTFFR